MKKTLLASMAAIARCIPRARLMFLKAVRPDMFVDGAPADAAKQGA